MKRNDYIRIEADDSVSVVNVGGWDGPITCPAIRIGNDVLITGDLDKLRAALAEVKG